MTKVMKMLTILSIRVALYREMSVFFVFAASSGVRKYFCSKVSNPLFVSGRNQWILPKEEAASG